MCEALWLIKEKMLLVPLIQLTCIVEILFVARRLLRQTCHIITRGVNVAATTAATIMVRPRL